MTILEMTPAEIHRPDFHLFASALSAKFEATSKEHKLYRVELPHNALFDAYLSGFDAQHRQYYNCDCCKRFLNQFGGLVTIDKEGVTKSALWHLTIAESSELAATDSSLFLPSMQAMRLAVEKAKVKTTFLSKYPILGTPEKGGWQHMFVKQGDVYNKLTPTAGQAMLTSRENRRILAGFMGGANLDVLKKITVYFKNDAQLKNVTSAIRVFEWAVAFKEAWSAEKNPAKAGNMLWHAVGTKTMGYLRVGGGVSGEFYDTVANGGSFEDAKRNFLSQTDLSKYMKTTSAPKAGNVASAEAVFADTPGLKEALQRRPAKLEDIVSFVWTPPGVEPVPEAPKSVFGHLKTKEAEKKPAAPDLPVINGGVITAQRFMREVLPKALKLFVRLNNQRYHLAGTTTAVDPEAHPLTLWDTPEQRNPVTNYTYHEGSAPNYWDMPAGLIEVTHIVPMGHQWTKSADAILADGDDVLLVLKGAVDNHIDKTPLSDALIRRDLHGIRFTLQRYFDTTPMTKLAEGETPVNGLAFPVKTQAAMIGVAIRVVTADAVVEYLVDRSN